MENKYYTPTIEEFHVGFEYEYRSSDKTKWSDCIIDKKDLTSSNMDWCAPNWIEDVFDQLESGGIRVKYLDKEDIESLGWKHVQTKSIGKDHYEGIFKNSNRGKMLFEHDWLNNKITIKTPNWIRDGSERFDGYIVYIERLIIKNKSELKVLMKQLRINE